MRIHNAVHVYNNTQYEHACPEICKCHRSIECPYASFRNVGMRRQRRRTSQSMRHRTMCLDIVGGMGDEKSLSQSACKAGLPANQEGGRLSARE